MPPKGFRKTNVQKTLVVSNPSKFLNANMKKNLLELQGKTFIQEKGFEPSMVLCKEIWSLVRYCRDQEARRRYNAIWETVTIRDPKSKGVKDKKKLRKKKKRRRMFWDEIFKRRR
ncbi:hypothetical protein PVK06_008311 [Gossypium arboreum]|uniref:Uncharacterized protein n=1 Tax=Gossypium arboreum TaxID=29729 RepID=A0ABR0QKY3_GOSAR|nr:hypothetical protein PVK06_008311 [Gossypium arboreum]